MAAQHDRRHQKLVSERRRHIERHRIALAALGLPFLPQRGVLLHEVVEGLQEAADREGRRRLGAAAKAERQHRAARQFGDQRDVARPGPPVLPAHPAVAGEILPAVADADVAGARPPNRVALALVDRGEGGAERPLLGAQGEPAVMRHHRRGVAVAGRAQMRRQQDVGTQPVVAIEPAFDRQHVAPRSRRDPQQQRIALVAMDDLDRRHPRRQQPQLVIVDALDLGPEAVAVADDKAEVANLRDVNPRVVDFVDDAEAEREPQPRGPERAADHVLGAARPGRRNSGSARGVLRHRRDPGFSRWDMVGSRYR